MLAAVCTLPLLAASEADKAPVESTKQLFPLPKIPLLTNPMSDYPEYAQLDKTIQHFMRKWKLNGASVALARHGQMLYAKGFGYADVEQQAEVTPQHIFRVASVSKLITAAAVMRLVEDGKLQLSDTIFGANGLLNDSIFLHIRDRRATQITVRNLLEHSAGWNAARYGDPMFMHATIARERHLDLPVSMDNIIAYVLSKRLHFNVGSRSCYSNFGFAVLGRVVEKASGMTYEDYVNRELLTPMGIDSARIGNAYPHQRYDNEVAYYDKHNTRLMEAYDNAELRVLPSHGGNDIRTLGAAGGWVMSAAALLRLALCMDGQPTVPDILQPSSIAQMVNNQQHFSPLGWRHVDERRWLRTGSLSGTSAVVACDTAGWCWVFVTNTSSWKGAAFTHKIEQLMTKLLSNDDIRWRHDDLFEPAVLPDDAPVPQPIAPRHVAVVH